MNYTICQRLKKKTIFKFKLNKEMLKKHLFMNTGVKKLKFNAFC